MDMQEKIEISEQEYFKNGKYIVLPTEIMKDYIEHPLVKRMYITDTGFFPHAAGHAYERKEGIEEYILLYCMDGCGKIIVENQEYMLGANEVFCIPRYKKHSYCADEEKPWSIFWIHLKGEDTAYFPLDSCRKVKFVSQTEQNRMIYLFSLLFRVMEENYTIGNFIYISNTLSLILAEIYNREKRSEVLQPNKHVTNIIKFMYLHLDKNLSIKQLTDEFGLSKSYLNKVFKECTKLATMEFYLHIKMEEACKFLRMQDSYVYEVAQKLGYKDPFHFSKNFKKVIGVSPKEYQRNESYVHEKEDGKR